MKIKYSYEQIIRVSITLILLFCVIFANFIAVAAIERYGMQLYFYDKLLVAYESAGRGGYEKELKKILALNSAPRQLELAKKFEIKSKDIKDMHAYLKEEVNEKKNLALLYKNLRAAAVVLMLVILTWRLFANLSLKYRKR